MTFEQLINRIKQNKLAQRKMGELNISEIPAGTPLDHTIEFISFVQIAHKYREAYEKGEYIPADLTDEIFDQIKTNKEELEKIPGKYAND